MNLKIVRKIRMMKIDIRMRMMKKVFTKKTRIMIKITLSKNRLLKALQYFV